MKDPLKEARRWLAQAENDLEFARLAVRERFFAQACFICQQSGEKALKALAYRRGQRFVPGHSLFELVKSLQADYLGLAEYYETAGLLDQYYVPTRYPNGLPDGVPHEVFSEKQAREALERLEALVLQVRKFVHE